MSLRLYMDVNVPYPITLELRLRGLDVLTAQEDGTRGMDDPRLLDRASGLGRVLFTHDIDMLREATRRQKSGERFSGLIYAHQLNITIGQCVNGLELIARVSEPDEWVNRVEFLPLK